ncbi:MAG TPA: phage holin family protein [Steroidobacteraceae bacterium]|nr:phage holin family protein [Steroidobacteraceae bacterium]
MAINANERDLDEAPTSASGLLHSLSNFAGTLLGLAHTRLQLLTTELQEEVQRAAHLLVWAFVALFAAMLALFLGALTVIFVFWDTHRILAALVMTGVLIAIAIAAALVLRTQLKKRPPALNATLAELAKDRDHLRKSL